MNTRPNSPEHDEARWQAQERARKAAHDGHADVEAGDLRVARALRQAPPVYLPVDFAAQVAAIARAQAMNESVFEQRLLRGLSVLFGLSAVATVAWLGRSWPADLAAVLPGSQAVSWSASTALCLLGNWTFGLLRRQRHGRNAAPT